MPMPTSSSRKNDRHRKTEHRKLWKKVYSLEYGTTNQYYRIILRKLKAGSRDYQTLCAYCNWLKRYGVVS
jgi:hypothetical protein